MLIFYPLVFFFRINVADKILCVLPMPVYSHQYVYRPILEELSARGHEVTVITTNPAENSSAYNIRQIDLSFSYKLAHEDLRMKEVINSQINILSLIWQVMSIAENLTTEQLGHSSVRELIFSDATFDLMIVEVHIPAWFGLAAKYNCPVIGIISVEAPARLKRLMGAPVNPVVNPHIGLPFGHPLDFIQRLMAVSFDMFDQVLNDYVLIPMQQRIVREALENADIDLQKILRNMSLLFSYEIPGFTRPSLKVPTIIDLHGLHINSPQQLPEDLEAFLDRAQGGAIYFSLGSSVQSCQIPEDKRNVIREVFSKLPFSVLWKFEEDMYETLPPNVKIISWAPQQDILRHKKVKLFISQGGLHSIEEAILFKVPILGIPFFGDQFNNVERLQQLGIGLSLNLGRLTQESLRDSIFKLIGDEKYVRNMQYISDLLAEQPPKSIDKAIWWIEHVLKHRGSDHLRSPVADNMSFYRYFLLDVILFGVVSLVSLAILCCMILKRLSRRNRKAKDKPKFN